MTFLSFEMPPPVVKQRPPVGVQPSPTYHLPMQKGRSTGRVIGSMRSAFGKTSVEVHLAYRMARVVLRDDSLRVYRGVNLGTRKDPENHVVAGDCYCFHQFLEDFARDATDPLRSLCRL